MKRTARLVAVLSTLSLAGLAVTGLAIAGSKTVSDRRGDSRSGYPDIEAVRVTTSKTAVSVSIAAYRSFTTRNAPCIGLTTNEQPSRGDGFVVCGDGEIMNFDRGRSAGDATVRRPTDSKVSYRISRRRLGQPRSFTWQAQVRGRNESCIHRYRGPCDTAPNGRTRVRQSF